jgi:tRNA(fMet)-specific endonuclease VapC
VIVVDSDVLIAALERGDRPARARVEAGLREGEIATTAINAFELWTGARSARQLETLGTLLAAIAILPVDAEAAEIAAAARRRLEQEGRGIGTADYLIAGVCLSRGLALLTRNRGHFQRVPGLVVESV